MPTDRDPSPTPQEIAIRELAKAVVKRDSALAAERTQREDAVRERDEARSQLARVVEAAHAIFVSPAARFTEPNGNEHTLMERAPLVDLHRILSDLLAAGRAWLAQHDAEVRREALEEAACISLRMRHPTTAAKIAARIRALQQRGEEEQDG